MADPRSGMICNFRQGGEVCVDAVLFAKDGKFTVERAHPLLP